MHHQSPASLRNLSVLPLLFCLLPLPARTTLPPLPATNPATATAFHEPRKCYYLPGARYCHGPPATATSCPQTQLLPLPTDPSAACSIPSHLITPLLLQCPPYCPAPPPSPATAMPPCYCRARPTALPSLPALPSPLLQPTHPTAILPPPLLLPWPCPPAAAGPAHQCARHPAEAQQGRDLLRPGAAEAGTDAGRLAPRCAGTFFF